MSFILVTGGAGYIGSHMVLLLRQEGYPVIVLDDLSSGLREFIPSDVIFIQGDSGDKNCVSHIFKTYEISAVIHFAGFIEVGRSLKEPLKFYENNIAKSLVLLESMIEHSLSYFIFSSSAAVYGTQKNTLLQENDPLCPINPYGYSKAYLEQILVDCDKAYGLRSVSLRYFNASGADQSGMIGESHNPETHLIPLALKAATGLSPPLKVYGTDYPTRDGSCIRDYIHVSDLTKAHLSALHYLMRGGHSQSFNVGTGKGYSVLEVIKTIEKILGCQVPVQFVEKRTGDPISLIANISHIESVLGWKAQESDLEKIIKDAWRFHKKQWRL